MLAELRQERDRLSAELAEVERAIAALEGTARAQRSPVRAGPYTGLSLYEATSAFLAEAGEPKTSSEIARGLIEGGFVTRSRYFTGIVTTMLLRKDARRGSRIRRTKSRKRWYVTR